MKSDTIKYKKGYKYQLTDMYTVSTGIYPLKSLFTPWCILSDNGYLTISAGYTWDGASGPTIDTKSSMRGSLVHDALYQLMRMGLLGDSYREQVDTLLHDICVEDGMLHIRADLWKEAVRLFAAGCARAGSEKPVLTAP